MSLRDEHRAVTRRKILDAVLDLAVEVDPEELSVPAVSERSGVSVATIYRYFPTKAALLDAAAWVPAEHAATVRPERFSSDAFPHYLATLWKGFAANLPLVRRQAASPVGRELRRARLAAGREQLAAELEELGVPAGSPQGRRLVSLYLLLGSSLALLELHDRQGLSVPKAVDEVAWAARVLLATTREEVA
jgi:AcrR family transcriptional regulator